MYPHLISRVMGTPMMITPDKLAVIATIIQSPTANRALTPRSSIAPSAREFPGVAILSVHGTLVKRTGGIHALSGLTSYADLHAQLQRALANPNVQGIVLDIDSPGGEVGGVFDLANAVRAATQQKPIWAMANDHAFSAAYAIACACSRVVVTQTGGVGSIGVIALHVDQSAADAAAGLHYSAITAGAHKNDGSPHAPLSPDARTRLQTEVDRLYAILVDHVASMRGTTAQAIRDTQAALFFGEDALQAQLADALMSATDVFNEFTTYLQNRPCVHACAPSCCSELESPMSQPPVVPQPDPLPLPSPPLTTLTANTPTASLDAQIIAELCLLAGVPERTASMLAQGHTPEAVRQQLLAHKAQHQSPEIQSTITPNHATSPVLPLNNPLINAVKKLIAHTPE